MEVAIRAGGRAVDDGWHTARRYSSANSFTIAESSNCYCGKLKRGVLYMSRWLIAVIILLAVVVLLPFVVPSMGETITFANSPLHIAAKNRGMSVIEEAVESGVDVNAKDEFDKTPLHYAAENGYLAAVRFLLTKGADPNILNGLGETPHQLALRNSHEGTAGALKNAMNNAPAMPKPEPSTSPEPEPEASTSPVSAPPEEKVTSTSSPLHKAAKEGDTAKVEKTLDSGAHINAQDESGKTALHYAAENGRLRTIQSILAKGANANILDAKGNTALQLALDNGHSQTAGTLANATTVAPQAPKRQTLNPSLKFPDLPSFERAIGQPGALVKSDHVWLFAPKSLEKQARIVHQYLANAYDALYDIVGVHTEYTMVVYNFPKGHTDAFGGTSNCTIWYDDTNLRLVRHEEWTRHGVPHVSGYIEEMALNFNYTQFGWEMVGWSIGIKASQKVANNPIFARQLRNTRKTQADTFKRYKALDDTFPKDIPPNKVDRIHAQLLWQCEQEYGKDFWRDFFREAKKERVKLLTGSRDERYRVTIECFERLPGLDFRRLLRSHNISRSTDVKSLNPEEPGWNRKLW
jgi:hypothetical protein